MVDHPAALHRVLDERQAGEVTRQNIPGTSTLSKCSSTAGRCVSAPSVISSEPFGHACSHERTPHKLLARTTRAGFPNSQDVERADVDACVASEARAVSIRGSRTRARAPNSLSPSGPLDYCATSARSLAVFYLLYIHQPKPPLSAGNPSHTRARRASAAPPRVSPRPRPKRHPKKRQSGRPNVAVCTHRLKRLYFQRFLQGVGSSKQRLGVLAAGGLTSGARAASGMHRVMGSVARSRSWQPRHLPSGTRATVVPFGSGAAVPRSTPSSSVPQRQPPLRERDPFGGPVGRVAREAVHLSILNQRSMGARVENVRGAAVTLRAQAAARRDATLLWGARRSAAPVLRLPTRRRSWRQPSQVSLLRA